MRKAGNFGPEGCGRLLKALWKRRSRRRPRRRKTPGEAPVRTLPPPGRSPGLALACGRPHPKPPRHPTRRGARRCACWTAPGRRTATRQGLLRGALPYPALPGPRPPRPADQPSESRSGPPNEPTGRHARRGAGSLRRVGARSARGSGPRRKPPAGRPAGPCRRAKRPCPCHAGRRRRQPRPGRRRRATRPEARSSRRRSERRGGPRAGRRAA